MILCSLCRRRIIQQYDHTHLQAIEFQIARLIVEALIADAAADAETGKRRRVLRLQSRRQLFPQVLRFVDAYGKWRISSGVDLRMVRFVYGTGYTIL
jgi:hypothetical protein